GGDDGVVLGEVPHHLEPDVRPRGDAVDEDDHRALAGHAEANSVPVEGHLLEGEVAGAAHVAPAILSRLDAAAGGAGGGRCGASSVRPRSRAARRTRPRTW